jgi:hypothetical protein
VLVADGTVAPALWCGETDATTAATA